MSPAPAPRIPGPVRRAAVQPSTAQPAQAAMSRRSLAKAPDSEYLLAYQEWQADAKRYARHVGVARFTANVVATAASRVRLIVEELRDGEWVESEDELAAGLMDDYRNDTLNQGPAELLRLHSWHYQVAGEGVMVTRDGPDGAGAEWWVVSTATVAWDRPEQGKATVLLHPSGTEYEGTAFVVPREQAFRFWLPDEEYLSLAVSPFTAAIDDLRRYRSLVRYAQRQADNYLAMNGMLWTPLVAHERDGDASDDDQLGDAPGAGSSPFMEAYERYARMGLGSDDRIESVVPPVFWWDGEKPVWIDLGGALDEHGPDHRAEALADWARAVEIPAAIVAAGGPSQGNHWNAWLDQEAFIGTVQPTLDRVTHQDLTVAYLWPRLRLAGKKPGELRRYRVGYDATDVIVHPDKSDKALRAFLSGLLSAPATLREMGFDDADRAGKDDLELLAAVLQAFANGQPGEAGAGGQAPPPGPGPAPELNFAKPRTPKATNGERVGPATTTEAPPAGPPTTPRAALDGYLPPLAAFRAPAGNGDGRHAAHVAASKAADYADGVMVGLPVPASLAAPEDGEPDESLHMTLVVIPGDAPDLDPGLRETLRACCADLAASCDPPDVSLSHVERFTADPDGDGLEPCALVDGGPAVPALRQELCDRLDAAGVEYGDGHAFRPHVTLGYWAPGDGPEPGPVDGEPLEYRPDAVELHWGREVTRFPFGQARGPREPGQAQPELEPEPA